MPKVNKLRAVVIAGILGFTALAGWSLLGFVRLIQSEIPLITALQTDSGIILIVCTIFISGFGVLLHYSKPINTVSASATSSKPTGSVASPMSTVSILPRGTTLVFNGKENGEVQMFTLPSDAYALPSLHSEGQLAARAATEPAKEEGRIFTKVEP